MAVHAVTAGMIGTADVGSRHSGGYSTLLAGNFSVTRLLDRLLHFLEPIVEYAFGMHIGFAIGWALGLWTGHIYVANAKPLYFSGLGEVRQWMVMPYAFARTGAIIGLVAGAILIAVISHKLLRRAVSAWHESHVTEPQDIAHAAVRL
jgi:hypothetical protein